MKTGYSKQIQERINGADYGTIFVNSDCAWLFPNQQYPI